MTNKFPELELCYQGQRETFQTFNPIKYSQVKALANHRQLINYYWIKC